MRTFPLLLLLAATAHAAPHFRAVTIDDKIQIGYGVAVADVDGDSKPDILLADKRQIVWYRNPASATGTWTKHLIAENLTKNDHVCLAAQDIDGDGKCELAVGAEWNPGDTVYSGAVFHLIPGADRTQPWAPVKFPSVEPTTHRMRWLQRADGTWGLVVVPLHGRGNKGGLGEPVKVLLYTPPKPLNDPAGVWKSELLSEELHATHNFEVRRSPDGGQPWQVLIAGREGILSARIAPGGRSVGWRIPGPELGTEWQGAPLRPVAGFRGAGEVREGKVPEGHWFVATIEPMHGNELAVYRNAPVSADRPGQIARYSLTTKLTDGHALATGDLLGTGSDQIVVGWRGKPGDAASTIGVTLWAPEDDQGTDWEQTVIDPDGMACEDLTLADLNGDGKLDIVACGRATKNVKIYFNETPQAGK